MQREQGPVETSRKADARTIRQHRVGSGQRVRRFSQPAGRQRPGARVEIILFDDDQVDVPIELQVLKPVVQEMQGDAELMLGESSGEVAIARDEHRDARQLPREHQRLVARPREIRAKAGGVAHHDHAFLGLRARVASGENRWALAGLAKPSRQAGNRRCLPSPADGNVPDAHDGPAQAAAQIRTTRVALAPPARGRRIQIAQQGSSVHEAERPHDAG